MVPTLVELASLVVVVPPLAFHCHATKVSPLPFMFLWFAGPTVNPSVSKEIRSLAIQYKDDKDVEIKKLHYELDKFKKTIEENNSLYESMIDKTTQSLEKIISNTESLSKIQ